MAPIRVEGDELDLLHAVCDRLGVPRKDRRAILAGMIRLYADAYPQPLASVAPIPLASPQIESKPAFEAL